MNLEIILMSVMGLYTRQMTKKKFKRLHTLGVT